MFVDSKVWLVRYTPYLVCQFRVYQLHRGRCLWIRVPCWNRPPLFSSWRDTWPLGWEAPRDGSLHVNYVTLPISEAVVLSLSLDLLTSTKLKPFLASSLLYSFPMPSVHPVITDSKQSTIVLYNAPGIQTFKCHVCLNTLHLCIVFCCTVNERCYDFLLFIAIVFRFCTHK